MSQTVHDAGAAVNQARKDALVWLKTKIKSDLRIEADELLDEAEDQKSGNAAKGKAFEFTRFGLEQQVEAKRKASKYIMVGALNVTYWCPMPKNLWAEFSQDGVFLTELHDRLAKLTDDLVDSCAASCSMHELEIARKEVEHPENLEQYVKEGNDSFIGYCDTLQEKIEKEATEIIAGSFKERVKTLEKYKIYQFKAGAKLGFTVAALAASIAVLATAATPAAPATLVPALYGIITTTANILIQIGQMNDEAEEVEQGIRANFENIETHYKDKDGKERKITFKAREFVTGFGAVTTGGVSDLVWPSIKSVISETKRHSSKLYQPPERVTLGVPESIGCRFCAAR